MSLSKKIHTNEAEDMQDSESDVSGEEESDEGEQVSAGNEVRRFLEIFSSYFATLLFLGDSSRFRRSQSNRQRF